MATSKCDGDFRASFFFQLELALRLGLPTLVLADEFTLILADELATILGSHGSSRRPKLNDLLVALLPNVKMTKM